MRNFHLLAQGLNVNPLAFALQQQPELWNQVPVRTTFIGTPVAACDDILLRFQRLSPTLPTPGAASMDPNECLWYPPSSVLPQARPLIFELMRLVEGERLGRVIITRLPPGGHILPHNDAEGNINYYDFYHLLLAGSAQTSFRCGAETVWMRPGEAWWFRNHEEHELLNEGGEDRLSLIISVQRRQPWA